MAPRAIHLAALCILALTVIEDTSAHRRPVSGVSLGLHNVDAERSGLNESVSPLSECEKKACVIRSKHPGRWYNAELSWRSGGNHPMATVEFDRPVDWVLVPKGGNSFRIVSKYPGGWKNAELSWDGKSPHPRASVERHDPVNWEFVPSGHGLYTVRSKHPGRWYNAELSWDAWKIPPPPRVSVEFHDHVLWEIFPAVTVKGVWKFKQNLGGSEGSKTSVSIEWGTSRETSWSKASEFTTSVEQTASFGFEIEGLSASQSVTSGFSKTISHSVSEALTHNMGESTSMDFLAKEKENAIWQFYIETTNHHYKYRGKPTLTATTYMTATPNAGTPPKCRPSFCKYNTGCQECEEP